MNRICQFEYRICSVPRALIDLNLKYEAVEFIDNVTFNFFRKVNRDVEIDSMRFCWPMVKLSFVSRMKLIAGIDRSRRRI